MHMNNLVNKEEVIGSLECMSVLRFPEDVLVPSENGWKPREGLGPIVKFSDAVKIVQEVRPAIYSMTAEEAKKMNDMQTGARRAPWIPEDKSRRGISIEVEADTSRAQEQIENLTTAAENLADLLPSIKINTIRDCSITVNIYNGKE